MRTMQIWTVVDQLARSSLVGFHLSSRCRNVYIISSYSIIRRPFSRTLEMKFDLGWPDVSSEVWTKNIEYKSMCRYDDRTPCFSTYWYSISCIKGATMSQKLGVGFGWSLNRGCEEPEIWGRSPRKSGGGVWGGAWWTPP